MAKVLIDVLYGFLHNIIGLFIFPIYTLIDSLLDYLHLTNYIHLFQAILTDYIAPLVGFIFEFMGPNTITVLILEFTVTILFYGIMMTTTWIIKVLKLVKKLPMA